MATETSPQDLDTPTTGTVPGFRPQPTRTPTQDPPTQTLPADTPTVSPGMPEGDAGSADYADSPNMSRPRASSSPGSTIDADDVKPLVEMVVKLPMLWLNDRRAPGTDIWLPDDQDQGAIVDPLARIVARHTPELDDDTGDVVDGILAIAGIGGYGLKHSMRERRARAEQGRRGAATIEANSYEAN